MSVEEFQRAAGRRAADLVENGMVIGLGSGSTARFATLHVAERLREGSLCDIVAIPTSTETAQLALAEGIPLTTLETHPEIQMTIDGADEIDPRLDVIKGHGGHLLREKIVAAATRREIIVADESKLVERLGSKLAVPVEVIPFGWKQARLALASMGARTTLRMVDGTPYVTDEGNHIIDCAFPCIPNPRELDRELNAIPGVVETGLFVGMVDMAIVAGLCGVRIMEK